MAFDKVVDSAALDANFTAIADAIRAKKGTTAVFTPEQMAVEIGGIAASDNLVIIKSYISEADLLADVPLARTIGVITETEISSHIFSPVEPTTPSDRMVWIQTGMDSSATFNIGQTDMIQVCPVLAKQYIDGTWEGIGAKTYNGSEWVNWRIPLYDSGDEYKEWTGGWVGEAKAMEQGVAAGDVTVVRNENNINLKTPEMKTAIFYCTTPFNLTGHSTIHCEGIFSPSNTNCYWWTNVYVWSAIGEYAVDNVAASYKGSLNGSVDVDISSLEGPHYVGFMMHGTNTTITINKLYIQ